MKKKVAELAAQLKAELRATSNEELLDALAVELLGGPGAVRYVANRYRNLTTLAELMRGSRPISASRPKANRTQRSATPSSEPPSNAANE